MSKQLKYNALLIIITAMLLAGKPEAAFAQSLEGPADTTCLRLFNLALTGLGDKVYMEGDWYPAAGKFGKDDYVFGSWPLVKAMVEFSSQHPEKRFTLDIYAKSGGKGFNTAKMTKISAGVIQNYFTRSGIPADKIMVTGRGESDDFELYDETLTLIFKVSADN